MMITRIVTRPSVVFAFLVAALATGAWSSAGENDDGGGDVPGPLAPVVAAQAYGHEGAFEYLPPLQGQGIVRDGRFVFLYGPADGSGPMTAEAGTYSLAGDTVINTVRYHTDTTQVGRTYRWTYRSLGGDTVGYQVMNEQGEVTGGGRSIRVGGSVANASPPREADANARLIEEARDVIASHEDYARAGNLEGVMTNVHPDVLVLTADAPLVRGADAFRELYAGLFSAGAWDFTHEYHGAGAVGDVVELFGVANGTMTPPGGGATPFANNFHLQLRRDESGRLKVWRASFAPTALTPDGLPDASNLQRGGDA
jgi:ketosteroid isomerase-like protein